MPFFEAYRWPERTDDMDFSDAPAWIREAVEAREIRISDGYATVYTPTDQVTARPGDYVILDVKSQMHVCSGDVFHALRDDGEKTGDPHNAQVEGADAEPAPASPGPPYSSGVLARSAKAREAQAAHLAQQNQSQPESD
jgi:hypothetical protein